MYNKEDLIWASGFFDGEGSIGLSKHKNPEFYYVSITVSNTHLKSIERFKDIVVFGRIYKQTKYINRKQCYNWVASSKQAAIVLKMLLPFLYTKKEQAKLALKSRNFIQKRAFQKTDIKNVLNLKLKIQKLNGNNYRKNIRGD